VDKEVSGQPNIARGIKKYQKQLRWRQDDNEMPHPSQFDTARAVSPNCLVLEWHPNQLM
jgi:hypothetical protein